MTSFRRCAQLTDKAVGQLRPALTIAIRSARASAVAAIVQQNTFCVAPHVTLWISVHGSNKILWTDSVGDRVSYVVQDWRCEVLNHDGSPFFVATHCRLSDKTCSPDRFKVSTKKRQHHVFSFAPVAN